SAQNRAQFRRPFRSLPSGKNFPCIPPTIPRSGSKTSRAKARSQPFCHAGPNRVRQLFVTCLVCSHRRRRQAKLENPLSRCGKKRVLSLSPKQRSIPSCHKAAIHLVPARQHVEKPVPVS